jgi:hypothetical protein
MSTTSEDGPRARIYTLIGITTLVMMAVFLFDTLVWAVIGPYPANAREWFSLLGSDRAKGVLLLSIPTFFGMIFYYATFLALHRTIRPANRLLADLAALLVFAGLTILVVTSMAYPILNLGNSYAEAASESERALLIALGETRLHSAAHGLQFGGLFVETGATIFSVLMLRSAVYGNVTAYLGIVGHGLDLARVLASLLFLPEQIGTILLSIGGLPQLLWLILIAIRFLRFGRDAGAATPLVS